MFNPEEYKLLRIDLTTKSYCTEYIPRKICQKYIGGKGIGTKYLIDEVPATIDPLGPESKLFFVCGPLTGTMCPTSNRYGIIFKSPLTGTYADSYSGGGLAILLRKAGYFMMVIEGVSDTPIYIEISGNKIKFKDAQDLWGLDTFKTQNHLNAKNNKNIDVLCIGPAGENLVKIANIQNDYFHSAGRCGVGAVMGSKKLKAIQFKSEGKPPILSLNKKETFRNLMLKGLYGEIKKKPLLYGKEGVYRMRGTPSIVDWANDLGAFPSRYFTRGYSPYSKNINDEALITQILKKRTGCVNCPWGCGKLVELGGDVNIQSEGPEYETIALVGGACDIRDISSIVKIGHYCDLMGIDSIAAGSLTALAIESLRRKRIPASNCIELDYNQPENVLKFLELLVSRQGIGAEFAEGSKFVEEKYKLHDFAMHVKGLDFAGYDPRQFRGFALSYGVSPQGPTHLRSVYHGIERNMPIDQRLSYENKVLPMMEQEEKMAYLDSLIVCKFIRGAMDWNLMVKIYNTIYDTDIDEHELRDLLALQITMARQFNMDAGLSRKDDYLPDRVYKEEITDPHGNSTKLDKEKYDVMLTEYYTARGWDPETGIPIKK